MQQHRVAIFCDVSEIGRINSMSSAGFDKPFIWIKQSKIFWGFSWLFQTELKLKVLTIINYRILGYYQQFGWTSLRTGQFTDIKVPNYAYWTVYKESNCKKVGEDRVLFYWYCSHLGWEERTNSLLFLPKPNSGMYVSIPTLSPQCSSDAWFITPNLLLLLVASYLFALLYIH